MKRVANLTPRALDKDNVRDFNFLVVPAAVNAIETSDGTSGFAVKDGDRYVGAIAGRYTDVNDFIISSIFVVPDMRRRGIGTYMLNTLYDLMGEEDTSTIRADVNHSLTIKDENALEGFLKKAGFVEYMNEDVATYLAELSAVAALKLDAPAKASGILPFSGIDNKVFENFISPKEKFVPIPEGGFFDPSIDREVSMGMVVSNKLVGFAIVRNINEGDLIMDALYVEKGGYGELLSLLAAAQTKVVKKYPPHTKMFFVVTNDKVREFIEKLFPPNSLIESSTIYKKERYDTRFDNAGMTLSEFFDYEGLELTEGFYS